MLSSLDIQKTWNAHPKTKGLSLPSIHDEVTRATNNLEETKRNEINRIVEQSIAKAKQAAAQKEADKRVDKEWCDLWNQHYLPSIARVRQRLGLNDKEPCPSDFIEQEMAPFRPPPPVYTQVQAVHQDEEAASVRRRFVVKNVVAFKPVAAKPVELAGM